MPKGKTKRERNGKMNTMVIDGPVDAKTQKKIANLNQEIDSGKHVFLFLFMVGCSPCNMTKDPWSKIHEHLDEEHLNNPNIVISMVDKNFYPKLHNAGKEPMGFPTLRYIKNGEIEDYEKANIDVKDRSAESFAKWIKSKVPKGKIFVGGTPTKRRAGGKRLSGGKGLSGGKRLSGGKWSLKYKRSINCKKPKGFSQRQYCKYGRKLTRKMRV